ncbi:TIGR03747 family integrating conjugative element membrane protein [Rodentibacter haemolyticus]|uniref:TIGR03747 family integrating conjugative element membrane protein n=1 Tax=Rodentibacter haemolyticus TaxID=2778911 RepID=A0ABX6UZX8_9PAST|nr:TIGR03747 family integrating conjugative element membrane protein [Rodentibacter haemolyticus]QPB42855.1 TIGR03747 family integrating conjugative element membrane protein [Rodentibacter haemolyticus]
MAEKEQEASSSKKKEFLPCKVIGTLIFSLILSIIIEWVGIAFQYWEPPGYLHSKLVMQNEFKWFSTDFQQSLLYSTPVKFMEYIIGQVHHWLFVQTGIQGWLNNPSGSEWGAWIYHYLQDYVESGLYVIITFIIRLMIIVLTSPLFLLVALVGVVDGLVQRDLRRFGVGRESAFKYHHAKRAVFPVMLLAWVLYLSIPFSIHPNFILIPSAVLFGLMISFTAANFKKHL